MVALLASGPEQAIFSLWGVIQETVKLLIIGGGGFMATPRLMITVGIILPWSIPPPLLIFTKMG